MKILFTYKCPACGVVEEHLRERNEEIGPKCSECQSITERMIVPSAFNFKEGHGKGTSGGHLMRFATKNKHGI